VAGPPPNIAKDDDMNQEDAFDEGGTFDRDDDDTDVDSAYGGGPQDNTRKTQQNARTQFLK
jgi:hypothetical protein